MYTKDPYYVAMFVGAALNHPLPPCNGKGNISTIFISQYKTKFNDIRIYANLAYPDLVMNEWLLRGHDGEPSSEFKNKCLERDARHYRDCYLSMAALLNDKEVKSSLLIPANYPELLCETSFDLDSFLNQNLESSIKYPQYITNYYSKWNVDNFESLKQKLYFLCDFSNQDVI